VKRRLWEAGGFVGHVRVSKEKKLSLAGIGGVGRQKDCGEKIQVMTEEGRRRPFLEESTGNSQGPITIGKPAREASPTNGFLVKTLTRKRNWYQSLEIPPPIQGVGCPGDAAIEKSGRREERW